MRLLWLALACVAVLAAALVAADALGIRAADFTQSAAMPAASRLIFFAVIATLIVLVVRIAIKGDAAARAVRGGTSYRYLFASSPMPMWVMDESSLGIVEVNDAATEKYGYSRDAFLALTALDLQPSADRAGVERELRAGMPDSDATVRRRHLTGRGEVILVDVAARAFSFQGRPARLVLVNDVTTRVRAEEALARERALFRAVIDNLPDNVYAKDRTLRYVLMNPAGLASRGAPSLATVLGRSAADFYPAPTAATFDAEDLQVIESGEPMVDRERPETDRNGEPHTYLCTKVPLRDAEGAVIGVVGIAREITQLRRSAGLIKQLNAELEQRVRERTGQLEAANRELEAFSYSVSHDLRAPLRSIEGFSHALMEDYGQKLDARGRDFLLRIAAASQRMSELIGDLLALARVTRSEMACMPVHLSEMAAEIAVELKREAPKRKVQITIAPGLVARGDPNLLRVAMQNLLANAWKFSAVAPRAVIEVGSSREGDEIVYFVRDNGAGFDMAYADRLFMAFQRLHGSKEFPGTGVGLATVQRVIYRHGGRIWAEGAPGHGATFYFTVP